ncbi:MAG: tetratricopeptide repeat protein [Ktedonobacteraceae bacterium]
MPAHTAYLALQNQGAIHFGAFLHMLRDRHSIRQIAVLACLPGWSQANYSRLEGDVVAPAFADLATIYTALHEVGVLLTAQDRQQYLSLARLRIESKKSYHEQKSDREWDELRLRLSRLDQTEQATTTPRRLSVSSSLLETRHLVGRADWLTSLSTALYGPQPRKLLVLHGPTGIGKSSELHRLARHLLAIAAHPHVILCILPDAEQEREPENALDHLLGLLLAEIGPPDSSMQAAPVEARITFVLNRFEKMARPVLVLIDNAEQVLESSGQLAACWKQFLKRFLRSQHRAALALATKEWPGWHEGERVFVEERVIPPLSLDEGIALLHQQGLVDIPVEQLQRVCEAVGGIPQCLEWVASLVQEPLWLDTWEALNDLDSETEDSMTRRLQLLLDDNTLFGGHVTDRLTPLLDSIIARRLSAEAVEVLHILALANVPLSLPAVQQLCPRPRLLKELESVSLLMAYPKRVQLLPVVASIIRARLPLERQRQIEEQVIEAYRFWLDRGTISDREMGNVIAELIALSMKHHQLLDAAQHLILYGWMSFNQGHARRLARLARRVLQDMDWHQTAELECAGFAILNILFPFLGKPFDPKSYVSYERIQDMILMDKVVLPRVTENYVVHSLMLDAMNKFRFEEAQFLQDKYIERLELKGMTSLKEDSLLMQQRAWLLGKWCDYVEGKGEIARARDLREQTIAIYQRGDQLLHSDEGMSPVNKNMHKRQLADWLTHLSYHLNRAGRYEEALQAVEKAIVLYEQGYGYVGVLAASYGEKSQILMGLERFDEAIDFDEKAMAEIQRCADDGDMLSQQEIWIYRVNRGRLYLRLGRIDEAEQLLLEAEPRIHDRRSVYRMFAREALAEIKALRSSSLQ